MSKYTTTNFHSMAWSTSLKDIEMLQVVKIAHMALSSTQDD